VGAAEETAQAIRAALAAHGIQAEVAVRDVALGGGLSDLLISGDGVSALVMLKDGEPWARVVCGRREEDVDLAELPGFIVRATQAWGAIREVADRLNQGVIDSTLEVRAARRRSLLTWTVTEGIEVTDNWTDVFEPVRRRGLMSTKWQEVQPVEQAASKVDSFLRDRPDLT
jgi:hypothetical protein